MRGISISIFPASDTADQFGFMFGVIVMCILLFAASKLPLLEVPHNKEKPALCVCPYKDAALSAFFSQWSKVRGRLHQYCISDRIGCGCGFGDPPVPEENDVHVDSYTWTWHIGGSDRLQLAIYLARHLPAAGQILLTWGGPKWLGATETDHVYVRPGDLVQGIPEAKVITVSDEQSNASGRCFA